MRGFRVFLLAMLMLTCGAATQTVAAEIHVAVASNFTGTMRLLAAEFEKGNNHKVVLVFGSSGKHYAQIKHGAYFDAFFSADVKCAKLLEDEGLAIRGSRFTYATGKLILWSPDAQLIDDKGKVLMADSFHHLAIANPKLAPYGRAASEVLKARDLWDTLQPRLVRGENISQTFQFVKSDNAELGFVAKSQVVTPGQLPEGSYWLVPQDLHTPIEQQAVQLKDNPAIQAFLKFVRSDDALKIIRSCGYDVP